MDGTAGLSYYFASLEGRGNALKSAPEMLKDNYGAVVRVNPQSKDIYLVFTADTQFNGAESILNTLKKNKIKAGFFLTGNCLREPEHKAIIERIIAEGHYVGGHSDNHVLMADWGADRATLMTTDSIITDIRRNFEALAAFGIEPKDALWYIPAYEHYNRENVALLNAYGLKTFNYTPGTGTPADYTVPSMKNYKPSQQLIEGLYAFEKEKGLGGAIILIHPGISEERPDPLYERLDEIIRTMKKKGYRFESFKN